MKCLTNGKLKGGGQRTTIRSWNYTMFNGSTTKLSHFQLHPDLKMRYSNGFEQYCHLNLYHLLCSMCLQVPSTCFQSLRIESAKDSPMTPPLGKERPRNFHCPVGGVGYSSSESLDHQPMQSGQCFESAGLASTPKLSSISGAKTETSSVDGSARTSSSREADRSGELSVSNASDIETEWVEQDEPGVYITIRALPGGTRELRRVRFR